MNKSKELPKDRQIGTPMPVKNYENEVFIPKSVIFDRHLSPKAKGLLCMILAQPNDWCISVKWLVDQSQGTGKKAIQSGLKELLKAKYLTLGCVYGKEGQLRGKQYQVNCDKVFHNRQPHFRTNTKGRYRSHQRPLLAMNTKHDEYKKALSGVNLPNSLKISGQADDPILSTDDPKMVSTRSVVVDLEKTSKDQQQQLIDDPKMALSESKTVLSVTDFYPTLSQDVDWKNTFVGQFLSDQTMLTVTKFDILLHHFQQTSLRSSTVYADLAAVKKHFTNWYLLHLSKKSLVAYIEAHYEQQRSARKQVFDLVQHSENIFTKLKNRSYPSVENVRKALMALAAHKETYLQYLNISSQSDDQSFVKVLIKDIDKMQEKAKKADLQGKLNWFCEY